MSSGNANPSRGGGGGDYHNGRGGGGGGYYGGGGGGGDGRRNDGGGGGVGTEYYGRGPPPPPGGGYSGGPPLPPPGYPGAGYGGGGYGGRDYPPGPPGGHHPMPPHHHHHRVGSGGDGGGGRDRDGGGRGGGGRHGGHRGSGGGGGGGYGDPYRDRGGGGGGGGGRHGRNQSGGGGGGRSGGGGGAAGGRSGGNGNGNNNGNPSNNNMNSNMNNNSNNNNNGSGSGGGPDNSSMIAKPNRTDIVIFESFEQERDWVEERRRKRLKRPSKFDKLPNEQQQQQQQQLLMVQQAQVAAAAAVGGPAAAVAAGLFVTPTFVPSANPSPGNAAGGMPGAGGGGPDVSLLTQQQTRHARRLYVGNLPVWITEQMIHTRFRQAIETALLEATLQEDPILSVYINHERRFAFLEFKTVEMTTACMSLDGLEIDPPPGFLSPNMIPPTAGGSIGGNSTSSATGPAKVKIKRPNDYNPFLAPKVSPSAIPKLDVSRLGIISETVLDGPNKIFIGGLQYHLTDSQVLELLQAFGKVKAFHLVKNDDGNSKGYCFVEYADPSITPKAIQGLNGMEIAGKSLTARLAGERSSTSGGGMAHSLDGSTGTSAVYAHPAAAAAAIAASMGGGMAAAVTLSGGAIAGTKQPLVVLPGGGVVPAAAVAGAEGLLSLPPTDRNIVAGYDVEALVDAAMGYKPMPTAPQYLDAFGAPLTRIVALVPPIAVTQQQLKQQQQHTVQKDSDNHNNDNTTNGDIHKDSSNIFQNHHSSIATPAGGAAASMQDPTSPTRILVLHNMVADDDLSNEDDYQGLMEEVREECAKFGKLLEMKVPRPHEIGGSISASAIRKIFLEYASKEDAQAAEKELAGRQFGSSVVETTYFFEHAFAAGQLR